MCMYLLSFTTIDNDEEETNEETEEPENNVSNYFEVLNQTKQLSAFIIQNDYVFGYDELKTAEIIFEKNRSNNQMNLKQTNITLFFLILIFIKTY